MAICARGKRAYKEPTITYTRNKNATTGWSTNIHGARKSCPWENLEWKPVDPVLPFRVLCARRRTIRGKGGGWERGRKSWLEKRKVKGGGELRYGREDYARLLQTNGRQLRAICHIYRRRGLPLDNSTAVPRFRGCFRSSSLTPGGHTSIAG